jgi:hypothetical protein
MTPIQTIELIAWDLDLYSCRPDPRAHASSARAALTKRLPYQPASAVCEAETQALHNCLLPHHSRPELHEEMQGLDFSLAVVDLRHLVAFQRRLSFNPALAPPNVPQQSDWPSLIHLAFPPLHPVSCDLIHDPQTSTFTLQTTNPNLHLRVTQNSSSPLNLHAGSPFFEVAEYAGRWFLRDGYHRAYALLQAGIFLLPAVVIRARTLGELGATQPQFFPESILLSHHPPRLTDFLDPTLTLPYQRPPTVKTLRITIEETYAPAPLTCTPGDNS